jgi:16S rRNA G1207 methylase RsmC
MTKTLNTSFKTGLVLKRFPHHKKETLQAWDSADELILQHLSQVALAGLRILILNDQFGALSCTLDRFDITTYTDSYVSFKGIQINSQNQVNPLNQLNELTGMYDLVLIRIPKNMSFFEDILCHLSHHLHSNSKIICGYMIKHQTQASFELLNRYMGETSTSLAKKKARLIFANFQRKESQSPYPLSVAIEPFPLPFINHSNLFSREKLDIGTRFLLNHIPQGNFPVILDLGCANGVIGIAAKKLNPNSKIIFSDESQMAIQSAMTNYQRFFSDSAQFHWTNCYENQEPNSVNLVICNPPFHQGNTIGDFIAWQMFTDAYRTLVKGGTIRVIGNSHLQYQLSLKRIFGNSQIIATNQKFMIVDATK